MWSLDAGDIPVAHLRFGHDGWAVEVACKEDQWRLAKNKRFGRELNIERPDGGLLGSYYGRRWRSGGAFELANGTRAELRRSPLRNRWQIRNTSRLGASDLQRFGRTGEWDSPGTWLELLLKRLPLPVARRIEFVIGAILILMAVILIFASLAGAVRSAFAL